ncbi:hypothetical protein BT96DRAFT_981155 [Gymnopus androsaceus JB14]|uniref:WW domain-containing protein n=1 Tax=Gymnopus androsaceus JB14 TaxID=1447944 RepID=A0A6A4GSB9_9AGAR|nr:hypothetical protein BT96DRAFT_981155 [Gymnopus androsaceus JB14]
MYSINKAESVKPLYSFTLMSASPYLPNENSDGRPLPPGWITQYDNKYRAWFYVNTVANPPVTTWVHPLGEAPLPNPTYTAPAVPLPSPGYGYDNGQGQYPGHAGPGYQSSPPPPPQGYSPGPVYNQEENKGFFSGGSSNNGTPAPQMIGSGQAPPHKSGMGMGTMVGVGAASLVGGVILGEMLEGHHDGGHRHHGHHHHQGFGGGGFGPGGGFGGGLF